jgi:hypothetical protein
VRPLLTHIVVIAILMTIIRYCQKYLHNDLQLIFEMHPDCQRYWGSSMRKVEYEKTALVTEGGTFRKTTAQVTAFDPKRTLTVEMFKGLNMRFNPRNGLYIAHENGKEYTSYGPNEVKHTEKPVKVNSGGLLKRLFKK